MLLGQDEADKDSIGLQGPHGLEGIISSLLQRKLAMQCTNLQRVGCLYFSCQKYLNQCSTYQIWFFSIKAKPKWCWRKGDWPILFWETKARQTLSLPCPHSQASTDPHSSSPPVAVACGHFLGWPLTGCFTWSWKCQEIDDSALVTVLASCCCCNKLPQT